MSDSTFESLLSGALRDYAEAGVRPIDRFAVAEGTIAGGRRRGFLGRLGELPSFGLRTGPRTAVVWLALLMLAGALVVIGVGRALNTPMGAPAYEAIFLRAGIEAPGTGVDIVAVAPDGRERLVRRMEVSEIPDGSGFQPYGSVSQDGWVAVGAKEARATATWALVDLADPTRELRLVPYQPALGGAWSSNGRFATLVAANNQCCAVQVVDAESGLRTEVGDLRLPGGGPDFIWAADGSGLVVSTDSGRMVIAPIDRAAPGQGVPALAPRTGPRWIVEGGSTVDWCPPDSCEGQSGTSASVRSPDETVVPWYSGEIAGANLYGASFSADGRALWLLLDRVDGGDHTAVIARADAPGQARIVATADLGPGVAYLWFSGIAPDDSSVAVGHWLGELGGETTEGPTILIPTSGGQTIAQTGTFIGFMPGTFPPRNAGPTPGPTASDATSEPSASPASTAPSQSASAASSLPVGSRELLVVTGPLTPYGQVPCNDVDSYDTDTAAARRLITCAARVAITEDGSKAAVGGDHMLGIVDLRSGEQVDIVNIDGSGFPIAWSPSGRWLQWGDCGTKQDGPCSVVIGSLDADGTYPLPAPSDGGYWGGTQWSTDESHIFVPDGDGWSIGNPDGSDLKPLFDSAITAYLSGNAAADISPDAAQIAYGWGPYENGHTTVIDLFIETVDGSERRNLTNFEPGAQVRAIAWSPDGRRIAFVKGLPGPDGRLTSGNVRGPNELWLLDMEGGTTRQVSVPGDLYSPFDSGPMPIRWSPDGSRFAIEALFGSSAPSHDTIIVPMDGSEPFVLQEARGASWSSDGTAIAVVTTTGPRTIDVASADGSNRHVVAAPNGDPDGFWFTWAAP